MTENEVVELMRSSKSEDEWNANCDHVKSIFNGYPKFWYMEIIASGLLDKTRAKWGDTGPAMRIITF